MVMPITASSVYHVNTDGSQALIENTVRDNHHNVDATRDSRKTSGLVSTAQPVILPLTTTENVLQLTNATVTLSWDPLITATNASPVQVVRFQMHSERSVLTSQDVAALNVFQLTN
jgi:hypothetical protein